MFATRLFSVVLVSPFLISAETSSPESSGTQISSEQRRALETYVEQLDDLLEKQAQELTEISPSVEVGEIQSEEDEWKRKRDLSCFQEDYGDASRIRELECRADSAELHFEHREIQIDRIKGKFRHRDPFVLRPPKDISELPGAYYRGDGLGYNIALDLNQDQSYLAIWRGCLGEYGRSTGTWSFEDGRVLLNPIEESDSMKGKFREFHVGYQNEILFLFQNLDNNSFKKYGPSRSSVFSRRNSGPSD
jgi:hypothetical protein